MRDVQFVSTAKVMHESYFNLCTGKARATSLIC